MALPALLRNDYRGWEITSDPQHPVPDQVWCATAPDFDVDCIDGEWVPSGGYASAATYDELTAEIDRQIGEGE